MPAGLYQPGGPLGFPGSDSILAPLVEYATLAADIVIVSRNLHPADHESFNVARKADDPIYTVEPNGGAWPISCVKGTAGARIVPDLAAIVAKPQNYVVTKGLTRQGGSFSAFEGGTLRPLESLEDILRREEVTHVAVGGYWLDWCVAQTAFDANALGYNVAVELPCTLALDRSKALDQRATLGCAGIICAGIMPNV